MATIERFEDLEAWKVARQLVMDIYTLTRNDAFKRDFGLKDQITRSAGSIMDNIAEGFDRGGRGEFMQFLGIAKGSAGEVKSQLYRALDQNYISKQDFDKAYNQAEEVGRIIRGLLKYLHSSSIKGYRYKSSPNGPTSS